jgi:hypothetical protein
MKINLAGMTIRGKWFGIGECIVKFGHNEYEAIAVAAGSGKAKERFIGLPNGVLDWLVERGLTKRQASKFMREGIDASKLLGMKEAVAKMKKERRRDKR